MTEKRKHPRQPTEWPGVIEFPHVSTERVGCVVREISSDGAKLSVPRTRGIPSEFELKLGDAVHDCFVRWRHDGLLGVQFIPVSIRALRV